MPKRKDLEKILIIGSGPIVIGQACEFDYSGVQACKALREEGYKIILINSNPATIMTDSEFAYRTYVEPITPEYVREIIKKERPDALLPTMGGQTALNIAVALFDNGTLKEFAVELIGAKIDAIKKAEDRDKFKTVMEKIGLSVPKSIQVNSMEAGISAAKEIGFPIILRPSFTLGGSGGNITYNIEEFEELLDHALSLSPTHEVLLEESLIGWKEFELEVMRDLKDNVVIICSIENLDPLGVHTGDSITVAPAQTLSDVEYQTMRNSSIKIIREIGVDTGGSNIQFAVDPKTGRQVVIEMNPRVSRSSALASKATGFPIAKIAAKLAVGLTLDEIKNDITKVTPASFEPTIDYVVTKIPRFTFKKFSSTPDHLTTQMKSVGEVMAIGRTFKESLQKALRSLEKNLSGFDEIISNNDPRSNETLIEKIKTPNSERILYIADALRSGFSVEKINEYSNIDPWFLNQINDLITFENTFKNSNNIDTPLIRQAKEWGFSDSRLGRLSGMSESELRVKRISQGILPTYKCVDTCGAEFESYTPYLYSTYGSEDEAAPTEKKKVVILGGGPIRIGQGIEFDYCCVHAAFAFQELGWETIMVNCNPETVSTDYDTSDRLYFEPVTFEDVMNIVEREKPFGVIVQFGGQTPLKLANRLSQAGVNILGTSPEMIDVAEDREKFQSLLKKLNLKQPPNGIARSKEEALRVAQKLGLPVVVRPSYVLGGRAMKVCHDLHSVERYMEKAVAASPEHPVLIDHFLKNAIEVDVDAISDGTHVVIAGIMEHIEEAGIHSGDSICSIPPHSLSNAIQDELRRQTVALGKALQVRGLINIQFAIQGDQIFVLEVNPRASRTIPFISKAIGVPIAKIASKVIGGHTLGDLGFLDEVKKKSGFYVIPSAKRVGNLPGETPDAALQLGVTFSVKAPVFPFRKFPGSDTILGPEMKSTGEAMGIDKEFPLAFAKAMDGASMPLPKSGTAFISVKDEDKPEAFEIAKLLTESRFGLMATKGTASYLSERGIKVVSVNKVKEGRPHVVDHLLNNEIQLVINTTIGIKEISDSFSIRRTALHRSICYFTTVSGGKAAARAIKAIQRENIKVKSLQEYYNG